MWKFILCKVDLCHVAEFFFCTITHEWDEKFVTRKKKWESEKKKEFSHWINIIKMLKGINKSQFPVIWNIENDKFVYSFALAPLNSLRFYTADIFFIFFNFIKTEKEKNHSHEMLPMHEKKIAFSYMSEIHFIFETGIACNWGGRQVYFYSHNVMCRISKMR